MAKEKAAKPAAPEAPGGGGSKKLILMAVVGLLLVGISIGGTIFALKMLGGSKTADGATATAEGHAAEPIEPPKPDAIYFPIKPPLVINFPVKGRQRFLQAELTIMAREEDVISAVELHMPMIRNALVMLIGGQSFAEIQTAEGKELVRQLCLQEIQKLMEKEIGKPGVEQVLFTNFVMQ